ncbi:MAG: TIGR02996 domain-containing protein, partial [Gemmataceae bacterium]|nr:TIGR02996 domain-containing protein [Gemmataceae bacterium]
MDTEALLLRAICEQPEDDMPRLAFADFLQEQGGAVNVAWANGIRAQIWRARGSTDAVLVERSRVFDSPYGRDKVLERIGWPPELDRTSWERGLPAEA